MIRTSQTHPIRIATLPMGTHGGAIGVTFAPGALVLRDVYAVWSTSGSTP